MRLFLRHVAPGLFGETSTRNCSRKQSTRHDNIPAQPTELHTSRSHDPGNPYGHADDDLVSVGSEERTTTGRDGDQDLDQGIVIPVRTGQIVKTETTTIKSEIGKFDGEDRTNWMVVF